MGVPVFEGSEYRNNKSLRAAHTYSCAPSKSIDTPKQANIHTRVVYITARSLGQVDAIPFLLSLVVGIVMLVWFCSSCCCCFHCL